MKKVLKKISDIKISKKEILIILPLVILGIFLTVMPASADWAVTIVSNILGVFISALGFLLTTVMKALIYIASYSTFLDSGAVSYGWVLVRDICNMFFVVILLLIAFGTILQQEKYNYKVWLPKLVLMAILINFSKTICGLLIDIAQVVMLTFVNAFAPVAGGNMVSILGIDTILRFDKNVKDVSLWTVVSAYFLGIIYLIVAIIVIVTMMVMLVVRVVMIWIYVVLSPLAYALAAFPGGKDKSTAWWKQFTSNLIVGPVLAFFIWLSFAALQADEIREVKEREAIDEGFESEVSSSVSGIDVNDSGAQGTEAAKPSNLIKFVIAIGMLVGGLKMAQEVGGAAGSIAGKGMGALNKAGKIGMGGAAAVTGYRAAKKIAGNYQAARKSKREAKYQMAATKLAGGIGEVKGRIGSGISSAKTRVKDFVGLNNAGKKAEKSMEEAQQKRSQISQIQQNLNRKDGNIDNYTFDKENKSWVNRDNAQDIKNEDEMREYVKSRESSLETEATEKEKESQKLMKKQKNINKALKVGAVVGGVALGGAAALVSGGAGLALAGAGVAAARNQKNWGGVDRSIGSNWKLDKVKDNKAKLKDSGDEEVLAKMDNQSLDKFDRAAAALEAMERGLLSSNQAENKREEIKNNFGGSDKKTGDFKDKKMGNYFEAIASKNNVSATKRFQDLNSKPENERDSEKRREMEKRKSAATKKTVSDIESGKLTLDKIDSGAFTAELGQIIASAMSTSDFSRQYSNITDRNKKSEIVNSLQQAAQRDTSQLTGLDKSNAEAEKLEAMKKLATITDIDTATKLSNNPTPDQVNQARENKIKIIGSLSIEDLNKPFTSGNTQQATAIQDVFKGMSRDEILNTLNPTTRSMVEGNSPLGRSVAENIGLERRGGGGGNISTDTSQNAFNQARNNRQA